MTGSGRNSKPSTPEDQAMKKAWEGGDPPPPEHQAGADVAAGNAVLEEDNKVNLKPKITLLNGITVIVGSIIGSGIFVSPTGVLEQVGSVGISLIIWFLCGMFSLVGSYCYAELGCMITRSGADYAYFLEAFGPLMAFLRLWVENIIIRPCTIAIVALTFAYYVIEPLFPGCAQPDIAVRIFAGLCISK